MVNKIAEQLEGIEARYQKLRPLTPEQEKAKQREMREAITSVMETAVDSSSLSDE